jgi:hypothetical protein
VEASREDLNTPLIVFIGVMAAVLTFVLIILLQVWFQQQQTAEIARKTNPGKSAEWAQILSEQQTALNSYAWVDREKGVVSIPIERAMDLVVRQYAGATATEESRSEQ